MKYRKFGKLDWQVSALGFGLERLPVDEDESIKMLRYAIDNGVNFIDAGSPLTLKNKPSFLPHALNDVHRQKVKIAAAIPSVNINSSADFPHQLEALLQSLGLDTLDFLVLGGLNRYTWPKLDELKIIKQIETAISSKKINYVGFFFHDQYQFLRDIIAAYDNWTFCQFQYSLMDIDHHPGVSGLTYAAANGLAVVISKPLLGGRLTRSLPERVAAIWNEAEPKRSPAEWALRWVWNHPEPSTVVVDMSSLDQVKEIVALADSAQPESLTVSEELVISRVRDAYRSLKPLPCTACRGCMPCPQDVDAPRIFEIYNDAVMYDDAAMGREIHRLEGHNIDDCNDCGICAGKCGMGFPIPQWLKKAREHLAGK